MGTVLRGSKEYGFCFYNHFFAVLALIFVGIPVCLVIIQIKTRLFWRLLSVALALVGYCWGCSFYTHSKVIDKYAGSYIRGSNDFIRAVDSMTLQGRTNDVHQACQEYLNTVWLENNTTGFDAMISRTSYLSFEPAETNSQSSHK
jgi:hypothetical protein